MAGAALSLPHALSMLVPGVFAMVLITKRVELLNVRQPAGSARKAHFHTQSQDRNCLGNRFCSRTDSLSRCCSFPVSHCRVCQLLSFEAGGSRRLAPNSQRSTYGCGGGGHGLDKNCLIVRHNRKEVLDGCRSVGLNKLSFYKCGNSVSRVYASASDERVTIVGSSDEKTEKLQSDDEPLPTMEEIQEVAKEQGLKIEVRTLGPWFQINLMSADEKLTMGSAEGFETWWTEGKILHLESVRLTRDAPKGVSVLGPGFLVGAACVRYGLDKNCPKAELLAINDDETTHSKLVRYYSRLGFKAMYEVTGEGLTELADRVVWGGVGTRMDANCYQLLRKWAKVLRPKSKQAGLSSSKGFSSEKIQQKK